jgi:hypothetical protein
MKVHALQKSPKRIRSLFKLIWKFATVIGLLTPCLLRAQSAGNVTVLSTASNSADTITIFGGKIACTLVVDGEDFPLVQLAANMFADDVERVTGHRLSVTNTAVGSPQLIVVGTLDKSALIQKLVADGKIKDLNKIQGLWEGTLMEMVDKPFPNVDRALVISGSDRRGAAYGLMQLSQLIGVSPWYWWADVPVPRQKALALKVAGTQTDAPAVKYRGIFINDEDWGMNPWASKTFDPKFGNIGPKTYQKVFELMLRLRLNYLWPAMHAVSKEFGSTPENYLLADKYGIVAGSSHCEPMLCNNVHWNETKQGKWNYSLNRDTIHSYWEDNVKARASEEAVWTIGIRGIHDAGMESPPKDVPGRINLMTEVFHDQRELLDNYVAHTWGPVAQCFVPYKEVLPIYDAGLKVPDDVTLVWVDDNFGYIRRLSNPAERTRPGGAGVYWHLSYYGNPHSYTWIDTTAPGLIWEELHKAWENDTRTLWVINVGDIKPMEVGIDYFARLAWAPGNLPFGAQRQFLYDFTKETFGEKLATPIGAMLGKLYWLGTVRKPELMDRSWATSLTPEQARQLGVEYQMLLDEEQSSARQIPADARDAYTELVGFPVHVLVESGQIFLADRKICAGEDVAGSEKQIASLREDLEARVENYNTKVAGGKWNRMMPGLVTGKNLMAWSSQARWPWGEPTNSHPVVNQHNSELKWRHASAWDRASEPGQTNWRAIEGLGPSGNAVALLPVDLKTSWTETNSNAPTLEYDFESKAGDAEAWIDFLPTFRLYPGMKLRVAVNVDGGAPAIVEVPGSSGAETENGRIRSMAVQDNYVRARVPLPALTAGKHAFKIHAMDPGAVVDGIYLPEKK